jgi:hypothetical protein
MEKGVLVVLLEVVSHTGRLSFMTLQRSLVTSLSAARLAIPSSLHEFNAEDLFFSCAYVPT